MEPEQVRLARPLADTSDPGAGERPFKACPPVQHERQAGRLKPSSMVRAGVGPKLPVGWPLVPDRHPAGPVGGPPGWLPAKVRRHAVNPSGGSSDVKTAMGRFNGRVRRRRALGHGPAMSTALDSRRKWKGGGRSAAGLGDCVFPATYERIGCFVVRPSHRDPGFRAFSGS